LAFEAEHNSALLISPGKARKVLLSCRTHHLIGKNFRSQVGMFCLIQTTLTIAFMCMKKMFGLPLPSQPIVVEEFGIFYYFNIGSLKKSISGFGGHKHDLLIEMLLDQMGSQLWEIPETMLDFRLG
jgi:hypothetical protein